MFSGKELEITKEAVSFWSRVRLQVTGQAVDEGGPGQPGQLLHLAGSPCGSPG